MTTQYQDGRLKAKIEEWTPSAGQQIALGKSHGMIVRVYDHGPADGQTAAPRLVFDSEQRHGSAGVFGESDVARSFADRIEAAMMVGARWHETIQHERRVACPSRQGEHWQKRDVAKAEAAAANKRAKQHQEDAEQLAREADNPDIQTDVPLRGDGWAVKLGPSLTDGTAETDEWRTLVAHGSAEPRPQSKSRRRHGPAVAGPTEPSSLVDEVLAETAAKRPGRDPEADRAAFDEPAEPKSKGRKGRTKAPAVPDHVPDVMGLPLKIGTKVELQDEHGHGYTAEVIAILGQDPKTEQWRITVEDTASGVPADVYAGECTRLDPPTEPEDDEDD
jgi:hypothetical protein